MRLAHPTFHALVACRLPSKYATVAAPDFSKPQHPRTCGYQGLRHRDAVPYTLRHMLSRIIEQTERRRMDLVIELDNKGRIWVSGSDGTAREEAWLPGAKDTPSPCARTACVPLRRNIQRAGGLLSPWMCTKSKVSYGWKPPTRRRRNFYDIWPTNTNVNLSPLTKQTA